MYINQQLSTPKIDAKNVLNDKVWNIIYANQIRGMKRRKGLNIIPQIPITKPIRNDCSTAFLSRYMSNKKNTKNIKRLNIIWTLVCKCVKLQVPINIK